MGDTCLICKCSHLPQCRKYYQTVRKMYEEKVENPESNNVIEETSIRTWTLESSVKMMPGVSGMSEPQSKPFMDTCHDKYSCTGRERDTNAAISS